MSPPTLLLVRTFFSFGSFLCRMRRRLRMGCSFGARLARCPVFRLRLGGSLLARGLGMSRSRRTARRLCVGRARFLGLARPSRVRFLCSVRSSRRRFILRRAVLIRTSCAWLVLSCTVLVRVSCGCLILSCLVLSRAVLVRARCGGFVLSGPLFARARCGGLILSCSVLVCMVLSCFVFGRLVLGGLVGCSSTLRRNYSVPGELPRLCRSRDRRSAMVHRCKQCVIGTGSVNVFGLQCRGLPMLLMGCFLFLP